MLQPATGEETSPILVPVDLSASSHKALLLAAQLAASSSRSLVILHVVHDDINRPNFYPRRNEIEQMLPIEEIAERVFLDFVADMRNQYTDNTFLANAKLMLVSGLPATQITEAARQTGAGLILMGGSCRSSLSKLMTGSVSEQVILQCSVPVTIVHPGKASIEEAGFDLHLSERRRLRRLTGYRL